MFPCLSIQFGGSSLPCDLTSLNDLRRAVGFSMCSTIYLLLGQRDTFNAPNMLNQKPKENQNNSYIFVSLFKVDYSWLLKFYLELLFFDCTLFVVIDTFRFVIFLCFFLLFPFFLLSYVYFNAFIIFSFHFPLFFILNLYNIYYFSDFRRIFNKSYIVQYLYVPLLYSIKRQITTFTTFFLT